MISRGWKVRVIAEAIDELDWKVPGRLLHHLACDGHGRPLSVVLTGGPDKSVVR